MVPFCSVTRQEKELKTLRKQDEPAESVLKSWRAMSGENRRDTGEAREKPGWVLGGNPDLCKNGQRPSMLSAQLDRLAVVIPHSAMIT